MLLADALQALKIRNQFYGKVIFAAIDRLESLKGIPLKLLGLERFLRRCPEWVGKIVLVQVGISAFERGGDYVKTRNETLALVAKVNQTWPGTIQFSECSESEMKLQQRMALLRAADVVMVTPVRDGLNVIPLVSPVTIIVFAVRYTGTVSHKLLSLRSSLLRIRTLSLISVNETGESAGFAFFPSSRAARVSCGVLCMLTHGRYV